MPPPYETAEVLFQGYPARSLVSRDAELEAVFTPQIGMLGCSLVHAGEELLGHRGGLARYEATGSTMGIPLLHPWANRLSALSYSAAGRSVTLDPDSPLIRTDPNGLPIHGLVNASPHWSVTTAAVDADGAHLAARLDFGAHPELLESFPFPHELRTEVTLRDATLTIRTALSPIAAVPVSFGYHPYLQLPDVPRADWHVELPVRTRLPLDDENVPTGEREPVEIPPGPLGDRAYDDGYADLGDGDRFVLAGGGRRISLELTAGYGFAQVYAPPGEHLICFEPMTAPTDALVSGRDLALANPGETYRAAFAITVERT